MDFDREAVQRHTLRVLVAGQVLGGVAIGVSAAVAVLVAKDILGSGTFAGLAFAAFAFGAAGAAIPMSRTMARSGRRPGLTMGYVAAAVGAACCAAAAELEIFPLLLVGMLLFGSGSAANLLGRYTAADLAHPDRRARAISTVVWATTIGAVAGPNVLGPAKEVAELFGIPPLGGPYVISVVCFTGAAIVIGALLRPDPLAVAGLLGRSDVQLERRSVLQVLRGIAARPDALVGLVTITTAHGLMISVMTMTPLHLRDHGDSLEVVGVVISLHIAGMYAFAPIVGSVADRLGHLQVARAAAVTLVVAMGLASVGGHNHLAIGVALFVLGLAWSMATIGGSAVLTAATPPAERARVQGVADMTMNVVGGIGGTIAGLVLGLTGYAALSLAGGVIALVLAIGLRVRPVRSPAVR